MLVSAAARVILRLSLPHEVRLARRKSFGRVVFTDAGGAMVLPSTGIAPCTGVLSRLK